MAITPRFPLEIHNLELVHQGKTRDTFRPKRDDLFAPWASNRLSTHDIVHESLIEKKGEVLTALTVFWLKKILEPRGVVHHLEAFGARVYDFLPSSPRHYPSDFHLRTLIVKKKNPIPFEFVRRNRLEGSLYTDYHAKELPNPYGVEISPGMQRMEAFPNSIFTPTTKSDDGDVPRLASDVRNRYSAVELINERIVLWVTEYLRPLGVELIDTKNEFDADGTLLDEAFTPDSSRFTRIADIVLGKAPTSLDKQIARDEAIRMWAGGPRGPLKFSGEIEQKLSAIYLECFELITRMSLAEFQGTYME